MEKWKKLENYITELFKNDNPTTTPGSGNAKHEEDVVGSSTIVQCKYTSNKNLSLLNKDIDRLVLACSIQNKTPIFVTENDSTTILSIVIKHNSYEYENTTDIANHIISLSTLKIIEEELINVSSLDRLNIISNIINGKLKRICNNMTKNITNLYKNIDKKFSIKYNKLIHYDLFDNV